MQPKFIYPTSTAGIPFFYIIEHIRTGKYYAGIKYAKINRRKHTDSSIFMTENGYKTSSNDVKKLILIEGLAAFRVRRIRHFNDAKTLIQYEHAFLRKVNAKDNVKFFNKTNGGDSRYNKHSEETKLKISLSHLKLKRRLTDEQKRKISISSSLRKNPHSQKTKENMSKAKLGKKRKPFSLETKNKMAISKRNSIWCNNGLINVRCQKENMPANFKLGRK